MKIDFISKPNIDADIGFFVEVINCCFATFFVLCYKYIVFVGACQYFISGNVLYFVYFNKRNKGNKLFQLVPFLKISGLHFCF